MRFAGLAALVALILAAGAAAAFEVEAEATFPARERPARRLDVISTTDIRVFAPILRAFQEARPALEIRYVVVSTRELMRAVAEEGAAFDLAISSAMDLQYKLANDGLARRHGSPATRALPGWARWRERLFAFTQEPAVVVLRRDAFAPGAPPRTRDALIRVLRDDPGRFAGRVGTYDPRVSGLGYLFALEDSRRTDAYWRLTEVMGRLDAKLYCCSGEMIDAVLEGRLDLAYNVLGSYAAQRIAGRDDVLILRPGDYTTVMLRTALIPEGARNPADAGRLIDFLAGMSARPALSRESGLPAIDAAALAAAPGLSPIRLGPGLLAGLDRLKRRAFLSAWSSAMEQ